MLFALRPPAHLRTTRRGRSRNRFVPLVLAAVAACVVSAGPARRSRADATADADPSSAALTFRGRPQPDRVLSLADLRKACGERTVEVDDPYHGRRTPYRALPFRCALDQGFAARGGAASLANESLLLRARDGYTKPAAGKLLGDAHAFLAFGEPGLGEPAGGAPRFRPIDRRQVDPAPFYLVWTGAPSGETHELPWPYQLDTIEIAPFEQAFPHTAPSGLAKSDPGWRGYALFQTSCSACHAINGEGGTVGPELNVPRSIVDYRTADWIRAYVRNPQATRYTSMPAHPQFSDKDLDGLIAYFTAMSARKHDPRAGGGS